jgi:chemotaxis protein CheD
MSAIPSIDGVLRARHYVAPGQIFVATAPAAVTTILGSCVAVCLWDPARRIGGMNHFMLPQFANAGVASPRFGNVAMEQLVEQMQVVGARIPMLQARVYGGSCMFEQMRAPGGHLGQKNADVAREFLRRRGIEIVETAVGGTRGRRLTFHTDEGAAWLKLI